MTPHNLIREEALDADQVAALEAVAAGRLLLFDPEWSAWSDREIARRCGVHHTFVGRLRSSLVSSTSDPAPQTRTYQDRHGNVTTMNTEMIGEALEQLARKGLIRRDGWRVRLTAYGRQAVGLEQRRAA